MKECADVCLRMCDDSETVNYLVVTLIVDLKKLESGCTGDESKSFTVAVSLPLFINIVLSLVPAYHMRRLHGDMVTTTITSGLHRLPDYGATKVTAASEYKKRLFSLIYCSDKTHASLNGVPPLLNRVFCNIQPCLDLPDEAIFWPQDELTSAVSKLDPDGWDPTADSYHNTTVLRAKAQISSVREEVLEIALGVNVDCSESRIK
jgi:Fungal specific transcription factor domain